MDFVVEDGTGKPNAVALASVEWADKYFKLRGNSVWESAGAEAKQQALVKATDYIAARWGALLIGRATTRTQALCFPRVPVGLPPAVQKATAEYALRALDGPLLPDPVATDSGQQQTASTIKIGPITIDDQFSDGAAQMKRDYPAADSLIKPYVSTGGRTYR